MVVRALTQLEYNGYGTYLPRFIYAVVVTSALIMSSRVLILDEAHRFLVGALGPRTFTMYCLRCSPCTN